MSTYLLELNGAYIARLDSADDKLVKATGDLFAGTQFGSIRGVDFNCISW
jgi:hypothetical protein